MRQLILAFSLLVSPWIAAAQFPSSVQPGTRVRVWIPEPRRQTEGPFKRQLVRGTVESVDHGTLRLTVPNTSGSLAISRSSIKRLDVSRGAPNPFTSAIERGIGGAIGGAILFGVTNDPQNRTGPHYNTDWRAAGVGAAWGGGIAFVFGLIFPHEQWKRVIR